jgi:hypothetical protein
VFNTLTGYSTQRSYRNLLIPPGSMRTYQLDQQKSNAPFADRGS